MKALVLEKKGELKIREVEVEESLGPNDVPLANPSERRTLTEGLVLTIEPFFTTGRTWVEEGPDGWTLSVAPGALVAQFEHTVIVGSEGAEIVTA